MFKKYYVVFLMLLVPIISVSIISNIFDNINNKSVVSEPVKKEIKIEKESNEDEELDKKIAAISGDSMEALVLSKFLKEDPKNVSTMDGENYSVKNKTEVFKVSDRPLDIKEQGYQEDSFMEDGKEYFIYWK